MPIIPSSLSLKACFKKSKEGLGLNSDGAAHFDVIAAHILRFNLILSALSTSCQSALVQQLLQPKTADPHCAPACPARLIVARQALPRPVEFLFHRNGNRLPISRRRMLILPAEGSEPSFRADLPARCSNSPALATSGLRSNRRLVVSGRPPLSWRTVSRWGCRGG